MSCSKVITRTCIHIILYTFSLVSLVNYYSKSVLSTSICLFLFKLTWDELFRTPEVFKTLVRAWVNKCFYMSALVTQNQKICQKCSMHEALPKLPIHAGRIVVAMATKKNQPFSKPYGLQLWCLVCSTV